MAWQGCSPPRRADLTPQVVPGKQDFDVPVPYVEGTLDVFLNGVNQGVTTAIGGGSVGQYAAAWVG
jgi:hypothetical protein